MLRQLFKKVQKKLWRAEVSPYLTDWRVVEHLKGIAWPIVGQAKCYAIFWFEELTTGAIQFTCVILCEDIHRFSHVRIGFDNLSQVVPVRNCVATALVDSSAALSKSFFQSLHIKAYSEVRDFAVNSLIDDKFLRACTRCR